MEVYECQKCEEWFVAPPRKIIVHRYDTVRMPGGINNFCVDNTDPVMVCEQCYGAYVEIESKVGFTADVSA